MIEPHPKRIVPEIIILSCNDCVLESHPNDKTNIAIDIPIKPTTIRIGPIILEFTVVFSFYFDVANNLVFKFQFYTVIPHLEAPSRLTFRFLRWTPNLKIGAQYTAIT